MAASSNSERLTPLDLLMPRTYITALFTFQTTKTNILVIKSLQNGLDSLANTIPWLSGRVCPTAATKEHGRSLEIRYGSDDPSLALMDKGTIDASYEALSAEGIPPDAIPADVWPLPMMIDEDLFEKGAPVFGASLFRFADGQGAGLCISIHHNAVDATGFADIVRLWAQYTAGLVPVYQHGNRLDRLAGILKSDLQVISLKTTDDLFELHPEYSRMPPTFPTEFAPCTCKIFTLSVTQINAYKERLEGYPSGMPSTNTLVCALIWSAITRARAQRCPDLGRESSRLAMAVNGRRRLGAEFSSPENPYLGNTILYSLAHSVVSDLNSLLESPVSFAKTCDVIAQSQSPTKINSRHIAEAYELVGRVDDYRTVFVGWDLFSSRDLTITSWADLDLYAMTFGEGLGQPEFIRIPSSVADGVGIVLPRGRAASISEVVEIMVMLRTDDMAILEQDTIWKNFGA
ncbi:hypothetical protein GQX73_g6991 [Xylaria multiplex]|uniref:Uncharacterized protein n=1 Tax=Xylaria multiplex TaxID=323545 RepID=A0A7C8IPU0_9PEZI|nr:hypothetical protein GQX73_g6991 [Xylaria multiplex]